MPFNISSDEVVDRRPVQLGMSDKDGWIAVSTDERLTEFHLTNSDVPRWARVGDTGFMEYRTSWRYGRWFYVPDEREI